jgi:hypothetical protein
MRAQPFRSLNEKRRFFGLNMMDAVGIGAVFLVVDAVLMSTRFELGAFLVIPLIIPFLIPVRMFKRRKIIRDTLVYLLCPRRIYDPKLAPRIQSL